MSKYLVHAEAYMLYCNVRYPHKGNKITNNVNGGQRNVYSHGLGTYPCA